VGTLNTWASLQDSYQCFFLAADLHLLTTDFSHPKKIHENTIEMVIDWLAAGIDPARSTLVLQSAIPEHIQLCVLLSMLVSVSRLERVPTYKEQIQQLNLQPSLGLLTYPVLQAADILVYRATHVPVGEDQIPHLELAREAARRFNQYYGETFPEPQEILSSTPRLPGLDNRTMHTSYGNAIFLKDTSEETTRKVMSMYTDPTRIHADDPGHVENNPLFDYLDAFDPNRKEVEDIEGRYRAGKVGDVEVERRLVEVLNHALAPLRERRARAAQRPEEIFDLLLSGTETARTLVHETLLEAQERMGLRLAAGLRNTGNQAMRQSGNKPMSQPGIQGIRQPGVYESTNP
jgi:tryptophanyl-tRNA synthetase